MPGLTSADGFEWQSFREHVKVDGDVANPDGVWTVSAVLPQGHTVAALLGGDMVFAEGAYTVPLPDGAYIEVVLEESTTALLKAVAGLLRLDTKMLRGVIQSAVSRSLGGADCTVRLTTSNWTPGRDGRKSKTEYFEPNHPQSRIMIGVEATRLLQAGRLGPYLTLELGHPPELPVRIQMPCPRVPAYALNALRKVRDVHVVRFLSPRTTPVSRDIVLGYVGAGVDTGHTAGHMPAGWLSEKIVNSIAEKAWALQLLRKAFMDTVGAVSMLPIGKLKKGGDPVFLYLMFASIDNAASFCAAVHNRSLPADLATMLGSFLDPAGTLVMYCAHVTPEALAYCPEKELVSLFKTGLTDAARISLDAGAT